LNHNPQSQPLLAGPEDAGPDTIVSLPLDVGQWQDIKLCVRWENTLTGTIRLWRNGQPQTLLPSECATVSPDGYTWTGKTVVPPGPTENTEDDPSVIAPISGCTWYATIYRQSPLAAAGHDFTQIVDFANMRMASTEEGL
jgi:hypothetical protein